MMIPIEKREPISIVRTEPLDLSADRTMGRRAHRTVSARGHFLRGATLRSKMWREVGRSAAAGGQRVPGSHVSSIGPPPDGSFKLRCCRNRITSEHSRGSEVSRWRYWIRAEWHVVKEPPSVIVNLGKQREDLGKCLWANGNHRRFSSLPNLMPPPGLTLNYVPFGS